MPISDGDKLSKIEELKSKLFSKNYKTTLSHIDRFSHESGKNVPDSWNDGQKGGDDDLSKGEKFFMKTSLFKKFFYLSLAFFVLTVLYASYVFFAGGNTVSNENIDIGVVGNNFTAGGEEMSLVVGITNKNSSSLDLADLILEYPKGASNGGTDGGMERNRISLGTIPAGAVRNENVKLVLFGEQGSVNTINISLEYRVEGSNAIFVKKKDFNVTISSAPINLSVEAPSVTSPNQNMSLKVKVNQNATSAISKVLFKVDYPPGFVFDSATPAPSAGSNVWNLGDLASGAEKVITINGKMLDVVDGEEKNFRMSVGSQGADKSTIGVVFNSLQYPVTIQKAFIEANLFINGSSGREYAVDTKTPIHGEIRWTNNLDTEVNNLSIQAKISGNAVNRRSISADEGFYNSLGGTDVITWDKSSIGDFRQVNPGDSGSVDFIVSPTALFSSSGGILQDPTIKIDISISGEQQNSGYTTEDLQNSDSGIVRIISDVGFVSKALYYSGTFPNTGPIPPKVEKATTYTINWSLSNTANSISKAVVRSTLPAWMNFKNVINPSTENVSYDSTTREIVWNIGRIAKGTGLTTAERSVSFQISFTPSLSQVGTTPVILNEAVLTGHDDFANVDVRSSRGTLRTTLDSDPSFPNGGGVVAE